MIHVLAMMSVYVAFTVLEPLPSDVERFPPQASITQYIELFRAAREWASRNAEVDTIRRGYWLQIVRVIDRDEDAWRKLARARDCYESAPVYAVEHLRDLRQMLGERAYHQASMPGLPVWAFVEKP